MSANIAEGQNNPVPAPGGRPPPDYPVPAPGVPPPPSMALRTYLALRLGAVGVILILAVSVTWEAVAADCLQGSISAYYFTAAQSVFIGALVALGFVLIVLWGRTPVEDALLNLAGLLAPIVAFAPTNRPSMCGVTNPKPVTEGDPITPAIGSRDVINASDTSVTNNLGSYLIIVTLSLLALAALGWWAQSQKKLPSLTQHKSAFWIPLGLCAALIATILIALVINSGLATNGTLHKFSASVMFVLILGAVVDIGVQKKHGTGEPDSQPSEVWAQRYFLLAGTAAVSLAIAALARIPAKHGWYHNHWILILEGIAIFALFVFWSLQIIDRRDAGAPRRPSVLAMVTATDAQLAAYAAEEAAQAPEEDVQDSSPD